MHGPKLSRNQLFGFGLIRGRTGFRQMSMPLTRSEYLYGSMNKVLTAPSAGSPSGRLHLEYHNARVVKCLTI
jgi:hypothetical protein